MVSKLREVEYFSLNQAITCSVLLGLTISQVNRFSSILALERGAEQTYLCCLMLSVNYRIRACLGDLLNKAKIVFKSKIRRGVKDRDLHTLKNTLYCFSAIFQHYNFCHEYRMLQLFLFSVIFQFIPIYFRCDSCGRYS